MRDKAIIARYAEAYVGFALPKIGMPRLVKDMQSVLWVIREVPEIVTFFRMPQIPRPKKSEFIEKVFEGVLAEETRDYINYLISRHREDFLADIAKYVRIAYARGSVVDVTLESTFPMDLHVVEKVKKLLAERLKKNIILYFHLNPDLLGGIKISIGNKIIDGTIRHQLDEMRQQMLKVQVVR